MKSHSKKDPYSGELFIPIRSNQKFANRSNQIAWNNSKARAKRNAKKPTDHILDKNRTVLIQVLGNKNERIRSKDFLRGAGFSFGHYCQCIKADDIIYQLVYDYAIADNKDGTYTIKRFISRWEHWRSDIRKYPLVRNQDRAPFYFRWSSGFVFLALCLLHHCGKMNLKTQRQLKVVQNNFGH